MRPVLALSAAVLLTLFACGGVVAPEPLDETKGGSEGTSSSSGQVTAPGVSSSSSSSSSSGAPPGCRDAAVPSDGSCLVHEAKAGVPLELQLYEACGSLCVQTRQCVVAVDGADVALDLRDWSCDPPASCDAACHEVTTPCAVPPLVAGTYTVHVAGHERSMALVVKDDGAGVACTVDPEVEWSAAGYATDCQVDADCAPVVSGPPCATCQCEGVAIAQREAARYTQARGAARAQCPQPFEECYADCIAPNVAHCDAGTCALGSP